LATPRTIPAPARRRRSPLVRIVRWCFTLVLGAWLAAASSLVALRWLDPPFTAVQIERRLQGQLQGKPYHQRYAFVSLARVSPDLQHAVVAAEDARFYKHHGFDWVEIRNAVEDDPDDRRVRGASTITQQLVKNLFFGTGRSYLRKGVEATLVPVAEFTLGKRRILELYLNVVEWGPGVYGAEAAAHYHYATPARNIGRAQALGLAAVLPSPLRRRPERMTTYSAVIDERMRQMGW
jgi:monofunctional biosynthetic peptidoglycan transglycosylase